MREQLKYKTPPISPTESSVRWFNNHGSFIIETSQPLQNKLYSFAQTYKRTHTHTHTNSIHNIRLLYHTNVLVMTTYFELSELIQDWNLLVSHQLLLYKWWQMNTYITCHRRYYITLLAYWIYNFSDRCVHHMISICVQIIWTHITYTTAYPQKYRNTDRKFNWMSSLISFSFYSINGHLWIEELTSGMGKLNLLPYEYKSVFDVCCVCVFVFMFVLHFNFLLVRFPLCYPIHPTQICSSFFSFLLT